MSLFAWFGGRRFRPSLWPTLGALALLAATVSLGNWQRHRAAEKAVLQDQYRAMRAQAPVTIVSLQDELLERPSAHRYRPVSATGEYDAERQIYLDNRVHHGAAGYAVITPLKIEGSRYSILVDRGWKAQGASRAELPVAAAPTGSRQIVGRLNLPPARYVELKPNAQQGKLWQNLDIARVARQLGLPLLPAVIELDSKDPDGLARDWPEPDFGREQHLSYTVQWYSLAALTIVLYLTLNWRKSDGGSQAK